MWHTYDVSYTMLYYCTVLYYAILYYTILQYTILYCTILHYSPDTRKLHHISTFCNMKNCICKMYLCF